MIREATRQYHEAARDRAIADEAALEAQRLHLQALRSRQEADRQSRLVRDIRCLPLVPLVTPDPHASDPR